jgi:hypothetical protein
MYSTVVEPLLSLLYSQMCPEGGTLPDGQRCYRAEIIGRPDPQWCGAERSPVEELVSV